MSFEGAIVEQDERCGLFLQQHRLFSPKLILFYNFRVSVRRIAQGLLHMAGDVSEGGETCSALRDFTSYLLTVTDEEEI